MRTQLDLFANGHVEMKDLYFEAAGGHGTGQILISPSVDNTISVTLDSTNVSANALAKVLLDAPNEMFGDLSGRIQFTSRGNGETAAVDNANGIASFRIENGRLPSVAKIETLLTAANIVRGGVLGFNLNNLFRTLSPFNTNYFAALYGDFQIADGVIYTNNLVSDGENLDLLIKGGIRLDNGVGNLVVIGDMDQTVTGALGRAGRLSLRDLVRLVPGIGFLPGKRKGLINYVPGVGFVPGLGGTPDEVNTFKVRIEGLLDNPGSVKNIDWLN